MIALFVSVKKLMIYLTRPANEDSFSYKGCPNKVDLFDNLTGIA